MGELYDSAAGRARSAEAGEPLSARAGRSPREAEPPSGAAPAAPPDREPALARAEEPSPAAAEPIPAAGNGDVDGARLVALNMALSGESRAAVERYLEEHFELAERDRLIDEVYAAI